MQQSLGIPHTHFIIISKNFLTFDIKLACELWVFFNFNNWFTYSCCGKKYFSVSIQSDVRFIGMRPFIITAWGNIIPKRVFLLGWFINTGVYSYFLVLPENNLKEGLHRQIKVNILLRNDCTPHQKTLRKCPRIHSIKTIKNKLIVWFWKTDYHEHNIDFALLTH